LALALLRRDLTGGPGDLGDLPIAQPLHVGEDEGDALLRRKGLDAGLNDPGQLLAQDMLLRRLLRAGRGRGHRGARGREGLEGDGGSPLFKPQLIVTSVGDDAQQPGLEGGNFRMARKAERKASWVASAAASGSPRMR